MEKCDPVVGYLHRGDEKIAENMTYNQFVPYTDRALIIAPLANNAAYAITVERLAGVEVPERCQPSGTCLRNGPHFKSLAWHGGFWHGCGGLDPLHVHLHGEGETLYFIRGTNRGPFYYKLHPRIGGVARDIPDGWLDRVKSFAKTCPRRSTRWKSC